MGRGVAQEARPERVGHRRGAHRGARVARSSPSGRRRSRGSGSCRSRAGRGPASRWSSGVLRIVRVGLRSSRSAAARLRQAAPDAADTGPAPPTLSSAPPEPAPPAPRRRGPDRAVVVLGDLMLDVVSRRRGRSRSGRTSPAGSRSGRADRRRRPRAGWPASAPERRSSAPSGATARAARSSPRSRRDGVKVRATRVAGHRTGRIGVARRAGRRAVASSRIAAPPTGWRPPTCSRRRFAGRPAPPARLLAARRAARAAGPAGDRAGARAAARSSASTSRRSVRCSPTAGAPPSGWSRDAAPDILFATRGRGGGAPRRPRRRASRRPRRSRRDQARASRARSVLAGLGDGERGWRSTSRRRRSTRRTRPAPATRSTRASSWPGSPRARPTRDRAGDAASGGPRRRTGGRPPAVEPRRGADACDRTSTGCRSRRRWPRRPGGGPPVVALESTLISHGLPYPQNLEVARASEAAVRGAGAVPATVAIHDGRLLVGLDEAALEALATAPAGTV